MDHVLKKRIMRNVWGIYLFKKATSPVALQTYVLSFFVWQSFLFVSMRHVFANAPSIFDAQAFAKFYVASFINTEFTVQLLAIGILSVMSWLVRNIVRNMKKGAPTPYVAAQGI